MKSSPDGLGTVENESGSAKHLNGTRLPRYRQKCARERKTWKRAPTASIPLKKSLIPQNMQMSPDALGTVENESGSTKLENDT
jgi:hypothetical protein